MSSSTRSYRAIKRQGQRTGSPGVAIPRPLWQVVGGDTFLLSFLLIDFPLKVTLRNGAHVGVVYSVLLQVWAMTHEKMSSSLAWPISDPGVY